MARDLYRDVIDLGDDSPLIEARTALWQLAEELRAAGRERAAVALETCLPRLEWTLDGWTVLIGPVRFPIKETDPASRTITLGEPL